MAHNPLGAPGHGVTLKKYNNKKKLCVRVVFLKKNLFRIANVYLRCSALTKNR